MRDQLSLQRYSCNIPLCATPMLSRVEFFTMYIIPSACRMTSCAVCASCGKVEIPIDARTFKFKPSSLQKQLARKASRKRLATTVPDLCWSAATTPQTHRRRNGTQSQSSAAEP